MPMVDCRMFLSHAPCFTSNTEVHFPCYLKRMCHYRRQSCRSTDWPSPIAARELLPSRPADSWITSTTKSGGLHNYRAPRFLNLAARGYTKPDAELGIDVGYVRRARCNRKDSGKENHTEVGNRLSSIAVDSHCCGPASKQPRVWASAMPRTKRLNQEMTLFLECSGYGDPVARRGTRVRGNESYRMRPLYLPDWRLTLIAVALSRCSRPWHSTGPAPQILSSCPVSFSFPRPA
jgi:hypothetical protein